MKKVIMLREKLYQMKEFEVDPNEPDVVLDYARFENDTDEGVWNEYYRVGMIDTDDEANEQDAEFQDTALDTYNRAEAQQFYAEMVEQANKLNAEKEIRSREDAGLSVDKETLRESEN